MYLHTPAVEPGPWFRADTASGSNTPTTVYAHDGADAIPTALGASGSTVRGMGGRAWFWSSAATIYLKQLNYLGAPTGAVVTSVGSSFAAPNPPDMGGPNGTYGRIAGPNDWTGTQDFTGATVTGISGGGGTVDRLGLNLVAVKATDYTATAGNFVPVDTTSAGVTITLPTAPADGSVVGVKHVIQGGTNAVTVACGGSDVFNKAAGPASLTLSLLNQGVILQYKTSSAIWYVVTDSLPLAGTDPRYLQAANNLSDVPSAATARSQLGLGSAATQASSTFAQVANNLSDVTAATARGNLGVPPSTRAVTAGTGLTGGGDLSADRTLAVSYGTAGGTAAQGNDSRITGALQAASNLSDVASASTARTNLGLGTAATAAASSFAQVANNLSDLANAATARTNLGLGSAATISSTAGGDLSGTLPSPTVAKVNGVSVSGTPQSGYLLTATGASAATWQAAAGGGTADKLGLAPTAVKTSNYTAAAGELVPVDTTSGAVTVTLPTAPTDGSVLAVKHVIRGSTNTVTIAAGGSDVFNKASGSTTLTLTLVNEASLLQYKSTGAIWYVVSNDAPLSSFDTRYLQVANNLADVTAATARTNLGLGTAATISSTAGGDLSGTLPSPTVAKINGVAVTGTPSVGYVPTATSSSAATWQAGGGGGGAVSSVAGQTGAVTGAQIAADPALAPAVAAGNLYLAANFR